MIAAISRAAKVSLVFVDACRNDPRVRAGGGAGRGLARISGAESENVFVGLSTRLGDTAADGDAGAGSPFARAFVANMTKPGLRVDDAFTELRKAVMDETGGDQRPETARNDLDAPIVLVSGDAGGTREEAAWARTKELAAVWQEQIGELERQLHDQQAQVARTQAMVRRYAESIMAEVERYQAEYTDGASLREAEELSRWAALRMRDKAGTPVADVDQANRLREAQNALDDARAEIARLATNLEGALSAAASKDALLREQTAEANDPPASSISDEWRCASITRGRECRRGSKTFTCDESTFGWRC